MTWVRAAEDGEPIANILASHSLNPAALDAHLRLYRTIMFGASPLSRAEREAIAVAVSSANDCHYGVAHHGAALGRESGDASLAEAVASGAFDELPPRMASLCRYALKLTRAPAAVAAGDVDELRAAGFDDRAIVDANQVVSYFNYVNRIADGLGVELEPDWPEDVRKARTYPLATQPVDVPDVPAESLPWLTVTQMREVDRLMVDELGISLERMTENAGRNLALLARALLGGNVAGRRVLVLAGSGGNGAGGLAAARQLAAAGADVEVRLSAPFGRLRPVTADQAAILSRLGVNVQVGAGDGLPEAGLVVDALLGYSQAGRPRGEAARLIERAADRRVLALDVPSGLELETGTLHEPHIRANATLTLAAPKEGLRGQPAVGELYLGDITVPPGVFARLGVAYEAPFGGGPVVQLR